MTMMRLHTLTIALLGLAGTPALAADAGCSAIQLANQKADADTIKKLETAWLTAEYRGDVAFLGCLLHPGYSVISAKTGAIHSRADLLASFAKNKGSTREIPPLETKVIVNGPYATAYSTMTGQKQNGESYEASFVDSYIFHDDHWEAVGGADL